MKFGEITKTLHPQFDERGKSVTIESPHKASNISDLSDHTKSCTIVPGQKNLPNELNSVKFGNHTHGGDWNKVDGQGEFHEPELPKSSKPLATGVIIHEKDGRIWTISPTNQFGGYKNVIGPKGKMEPGLNPRANAIKEAHEETGLKVHLTGHAHDVERSTSVTRYYHGVRVGGSPSDMGWETQAMHLVPKHKLMDHLDSAYDKEVAQKILKPNPGENK